LRASRGMGAISPSKMPSGSRKARRDNTDFTQYAEGGDVNAAGNYTKPEVRKRIVSQVKAAATQGTGAGQWSARKAQLVAKKYKAAGGGYRDGVAVVPPAPGGWGSRGRGRGAPTAPPPPRQP
jgi:hypothetical protein